MNLIDKDALIESLGIETDCYDCEHERMKYHCDLDPVEACTKIIEAPVITVTTESAKKAIEVLKNAAWLGAVYSFEETEEAVKTAIRALQAVSAYDAVLQIPTAEPEHNVHDFPKDADCISRADAVDAISKIKRTDNWQAAVSMALLDLPSAQPKVRTQMSLADCISRQWAIDAVLDVIPYDGYWKEQIEKAVNALPTAQPEIIRCKDCKHFTRDIPCVEGHYDGCDEWTDNGNEIMVAEDDFCSYAERRTDGTEDTD